MGSNIDKLSEVKVTCILAEHNLPFSTTDNLEPLFQNIFPDLKIAKVYGCGKTKPSWILNCAIAAELQETPVNQKKPNKNHLL